MSRGLVGDSLTYDRPGISPRLTPLLSWSILLTLRSAALVRRGESAHGRSSSGDGFLPCRRMGCGGPVSRGGQGPHSINNDDHLGALNTLLVENPIFEDRGNFRVLDQGRHHTHCRDPGSRAHRSS